MESLLQKSISNQEKIIKLLQISNDNQEENIKRVLEFHRDFLRIIATKNEVNFNTSGYCIERLSKLKKK